MSHSASSLFELRDKLLRCSLQQFKNYVQSKRINLDSIVIENLFNQIYHSEKFNRSWIDYLNYFIKIYPQLVHIKINEGRRLIEDVASNGKIDQFKQVAEIMLNLLVINQYSINNLIVLALKRKNLNEVSIYVNQILNYKDYLAKGEEIKNNYEEETYLVKFALERSSISTALALLESGIGKLTNQNQQLFLATSIKISKKQSQAFYQFIEKYLNTTHCNPRKINHLGQTFYERLTLKQQKQKIQDIIRNYEAQYPQRKQQHVRRSQNKPRSSYGAGEHQKHYNTESINNNLSKQMMIINLRNSEDQLLLQKEVGKLYQSHINEQEQQSRCEKNINKEKVSKRVGIIKKQELRYYLNQDILYVVKTIKEEAQRYRQAFLEIIEKIKQVLGKINTEIEIFGSFQTELCLLQSDIDIVAIPKEQQQNFNASIFLEEISQTLIRYMDQFQQIKYIRTATVPIIKITCSAIYHHKKIDITYKDKQHNGIESVELVKRHLNFYPQLEYLIFILKKFIYSSNLFAPYKGGLSSYGLILMIIAFIQHYYKQCQKENRDKNDILIADILMGFLKFYGFGMNYVMKSISIFDIQNPAQWKNYNGCVNAYVDQLNPIADLQPKLVIIDPLNHINNVGRATHRIKQIQMAFGIACTAIHAFYQCNQKRRCESFRIINQIKINDIRFKDNQRPCCIVKRMFSCTKKFICDRFYQ